MAFSLTVLPAPRMMISPTVQPCFRTMVLFSPETVKQSMELSMEMVRSLPVTSTREALPAKYTWPVPSPTVRVPRV